MKKRIFPEPRRYNYTKIHTIGGGRIGKEILLRAATAERFDNNLRVNCEGGVGFSREVRKLVKKGFLRLVRPYPGRDNMMVRGGHPVRTSHVELTEKGWAQVEKIEGVKI